MNPTISQIHIHVINNFEGQYNTNRNMFVLFCYLSFIKLLINTRENKNCKNIVSHQFRKYV